MTDLQTILAEPEDTRPLIEQAMDLLNEHDREAFENALRSSLYPSPQLRTALASDGAIRDAGKIPSADTIHKYRKARGWV